MNQENLWWIVLAIGSTPAWGALLWVVWQGQVRPRLISARQIETEATDLITRYGDNALEMAVIEEDRAWRYSDSFEQGRWRRMRLAILSKKPTDSKSELKPHFTIKSGHR
jgi:hypothetical protein